MAPIAATVAVHVDLRYRGQEHAVTVAAPDLADAARVAEDFAALHRRLYGFILDDGEVELVGVRVTALGPAPPRSLPAPPAVGSGRPSPGGVRRTYFERGGWQMAQVYAEGALAPGHECTGPALVDGATSTVSVPPGWHLRVGRMAELHLLAGEGGT